MAKPTLLTGHFQFISKDEGDTCANYAKILPDGQVEVETLRRYGRPYSRIMSAEEFTQLLVTDKI